MATAPSIAPLRAAPRRTDALQFPGIWSGRVAMIKLPLAVRA
jgi:hypothetical protein